MPRRTVSLLLLLVAAVALALLWLSMSESRLLYQPMRELETTPDRAGMRYEDVALVARDGVRIHGWYLPHPDTSGGVSRPTVLLLHGNAGNISHRLDKIAMLHSCGAHVLIVDYRGYGRSEGRPGERGTYLDAEAAYEHLTHERGVDPRGIVLLGESLGSGPAADLASRLEVGGVILEEAFTSIADVAREMFRLPVGWLVRNRYDTLSKVGRVRAPILILHSRDDEYFGLRHAHRLRAATRARAWMVELRGGHNEAFMVSAEVWMKAVREFLQEVIAHPDREPRGPADPAARTD